ncbi:MAG: hypothetical protein J6L85_01465 [Clostridia bacterium]|nr:hypothetical protein [Clostridia bacterium]
MLKKTAPNRFLDESLIWDLHNALESSDIFKYEDPLKHKYNLFCAFKYRMFSSVKYLNEHSSSPQTEEEFISFLVYATMLQDGVDKVYENVYHKRPSFVDEKKYFANVRTYTEPFFTEETQPTDDVFFKYLRSMAFAHPYETSKGKRNRPFMQDGETQICPWVIVDRGLLSFSVKNAVGLRIYSNKFEDELLDIVFSFDDLKAYIKSRFECIKEITEWVKAELEDHHSNWQKTKINREQEPLVVFKEIKSILNSRFQDEYSIDEIISYLQCPLTAEKNAPSVERFRNAIIELIPKLCDCIDSLDTEGMEQIIDTVFLRPQNMHQQAHYQLEKIFDYLDKRSLEIDPFSNEAWGLIQADAFSQEFAKKWVSIDTKTMDYDEIKLLVSTACYLEAKEQEKGK